MPDQDCIDRYARLLKKLFPVGVAWEHVKEDVLGLFQGMAVELCRIDERAKDLLLEFDPRTSTELLSDWETLLDLPEACTPENIDINERRIAAGQKLAAQGGQSAAFLEAVAARLGYNAIITDYKPFLVGKSRVGDPLTNHFDIPFRIGMRVGEQLYQTGWRYVFQVNVESDDVEPFRVGQNVVGDPLVFFGNPVLECTIFKLKPAHTQPFFTFRAP